MQRMQTLRAVLSISVILAAVASSAADFEIPLDLRPHGGAGGMRDVTNGVPLLAGQAMDVDELHVIGPDGRQIPAQFRVLARWWRKDNSIRWVLVSFPRAAGDNGNVVYKLVGRKAGAPRPATAMKVTEDDEFIRIDTGAALFEISKKRFNLLNRVVVGGQTLVYPDEKSGSVVTDPEGRKYYSSAGTQSVRILESGPVMVQVLAQGWHVSGQAGAFKPGLYGYEISMTFYAGRPVAIVDAILTNNSAKPIGEPHFKDWSLITRIGKAAGAWSFKSAGDKQTHELSGRAGQSALLYQDSVGTDAWKEATGLKLRGSVEDRPVLPTFRGYKVWAVGPDDSKAVGAGDFARAVSECRLGDLACTVSPRYFWQQFPSAIGFGGDGVIRLSPFPREYSTVHWLEDASAKAQEFQLCFAVGDVAAADKSAAEYQTRIFALPSPEHCGAAGALSDLGPYMMHEKVASFAKEDRWVNLASMEKGFRHPKGNGFGWQVFGMQWGELAGHSPWNYEPLATSGSLWTHLFNANDDRLEWGMRVSRHARDVRAYLIDGQDNLKLWKTFRPDYWENCVVEHFSRLMRGPDESGAKPVPDTGPHPYQRAKWPLPNMSHMNLDEVYDLYCLTGDDKAMRCMRTIADHGMAWALLKPGKRHTYRDEGWCMRALMRYYELTGDKRYEPVVRKMIDRFWADINKAGAITERGGTWYQAVYARGVINAWLATGDERMRDLAIGCADWSMNYEVAAQGFPYQPLPERWLVAPDKRGGKYGCPNWAAGYHIDLQAFAYEQTGEGKYINAMNFAWLSNHNHFWLGYFPSSFYMAYGPRPDKTPPAPVTDLKGKAGNGQVTLTWTAPGDDGKQGAAGVYQIKHADKPILDFVPWPEKMETHVCFWGAANVDEEPAPASAGTQQSYTVKGLAPGTHYFALKSRDECSNQSEISNVVAVEVGG